MNKEFQNQIIKKAESYIGQQEIPGNLGFYDNDFEKKMRSIGWQKRFPWCASVTKLIYTEVVKEVTSDQFYLNALKKLTHSVLRTWYLTSELPWLHILSPTPGGIICFGTGQGRGHMAICKEVLENKKIITLEGNTNKAGSREGEWYLQKERTLDPFNENWKFLGCIILNLENQNGN